jgi:hypothetical protein
MKDRISGLCVWCGVAPAIPSGAVVNPEVLDDSAKEMAQKHTTGGIPRWSTTLALVARFSAHVWQGGRDPLFSLEHYKSRRDM